MTKEEEELAKRLIRINILNRQFILTKHEYEAIKAYVAEFDRMRAFIADEKDRLRQFEEQGEDALEAAQKEPDAGLGIDSGKDSEHSG